MVVMVGRGGGGDGGEGGGGDGGEGGGVVVMVGRGSLSRH